MSAIAFPSEALHANSTIQNPVSRSKHAQCRHVAAALQAIPVTAFLIVASAMLCAALGFLLPPLLRRPRYASTAAANPTHDVVALYRQQMTEIDGDLSSGLLAAEHQQQARGELESRMLDDVAQGGSTPAIQWRQSWQMALVMLALVPIAAALLYAKLGNPLAMSASSRGTSDMQSGPHSVSPAQIAMMVDRLAQKLAEDPTNAEGWAMLARSYEVLGRYPVAVAAFKKAAALAPNDAALLADYADALAMSRQGRLAGKPMQLVRRALKADPDNLKALALAGTDAFDRRDYRGAMMFWAKAIKVAPADSEFATALRANLEEARTLSADHSRPERLAPDSTRTIAAQISGRVTLSAALRDKTSSDATLFVFARAETGPRMPLAIVQANVNSLPMDFILDDQSSMSPALKLSNFKHVIVTARVSRSGSALPQSGDLVGSSGPVPLGTHDLHIEISQVVK
jgi:cytochrome c-type biogenesis protein CcmH